MCSIRVVSRSSDVRGLLKLGMLESELMRVAMNFYTALLRRLLFGRWSPVLMLAVSALSGSMALGSDAPGSQTSDQPPGRPARNEYAALSHTRWLILLVFFS